MDKFNRKYSLSVQTANKDTITIELPFTIEFDVTRNNLTSANVCSVRIYNLSERNRDLIRKDSWDKWDIRKIVLKAGYNSNLSIIFAGNITQAWSVREGNNFITQIESFGGGAAYTNDLVNQAFPKNTDQKTVLKTLAGNLADSGVATGAIGDYAGKLTRGNSYSGSTTELLDELSGQGFFIDNEVAHILNDHEYISGSLQTIDSASGLLGTPVREETFLYFDMLFEPRLLVGQGVVLNSGTAKNFNGFYKINSIKHKGMISEAVCGDAVTTVGMIAPINPVEVR